ncbi:ChaN family lipoprotein [Marinospirillum sp.]|uniref:ChaN family lipoprotein n=1 Tax=Marinospirillum sp. TaxID=2183934 RepID=UPI00384A75BF
MIFLCGLLAFYGTAFAQQSPSLTGKIWSVRSGEFVQPEQLSRELDSGSWLFLGEQHDHPEHQRLATDWLKKLDAQNRLGVLALEMARQSQQEYLDAALGAREVDPESLNWSEGWPWQRYADLVIEGLARSQRVVGVDLDRDDQRKAYREGAARPAVSEAQAAALDELIFQGHCEILPRERLPQMRQVQLARDQAMAEALARFSGTEGVSLFVTGAVHARLDLGVPRWLPGEVKVTSVLMQEVDKQRQQPEDYLPETVDGLPAADFLWFTPALPDTDPCEELRQNHS